MLNKTIFIFLLFTSFVFAANDDAKELGKMQASVENLDKKSDKLENKIDEIKEKQKSVEEFKNAIADQNSRIQDLSFITLGLQS